MLRDLPRCNEPHGQIKTTLAKFPDTNQSLLDCLQLIPGPQVGNALASVKAGYSQHNFLYMRLGSRAMQRRSARDWMTDGFVACRLEQRNGRVSFFCLDKLYNGRFLV